MCQHSVAKSVDNRLNGLCWCFGVRGLVQVIVSDIDRNDGVRLAILRDGLTRLLTPVEGEIDDGGVTIPARETIYV